MIEIKFDGGNSYDIYSTEFKILEKQNGILWNATEEEPISVDKARYANGDYIESDTPLDVVEEVEKPQVQVEENL